MADNWSTNPSRKEKELPTRILAPKGLEWRVLLPDDSPIGFVWPDPLPPIEYQKRKVAVYQTTDRGPFVDDRGVESYEYRLIKIEEM